MKIPKSQKDLNKMGITRRRFRRMAWYLKREGELDGLTRLEKVALIVDELACFDCRVPTRRMAASDGWDWDKFLEAIDKIMKWVMRILEFLD